MSLALSNEESLRDRLNTLLTERARTGMDIDAAILSGIVPDHHPLRSRLQMLADHRQQSLTLTDECAAYGATLQELAAQLLDATEQCGLLADLLAEVRPYLRDVSGEWWRRPPDELRHAINLTLLGQIPPPGPPPTPAAYRSLLTQHANTLALLAEVARWSLHGSPDEWALLVPRIDAALHTAVTPDGH